MTPGVSGVVSKVLRTASRAACLPPNVSTLAIEPRGDQKTRRQQSRVSNWQISPSKRKEVAGGLAEILEQAHARTYTESGRRLVHSPRVVGVIRYVEKRTRKSLQEGISPPLSSVCFFNAPLSLTQLGKTSMTRWSWLGSQVCGESLFRSLLLTCFLFFCYFNKIVAQRERGGGDTQIRRFVRDADLRSRCRRKS